MSKRRISVDGVQIDCRASSGSSLILVEDEEEASVFFAVVELEEEAFC